MTPRHREDAGNRSQIVSGCVRDVCDALARVSALFLIRFTNLANPPENERLAANPLLCLSWLVGLVPNR